MSKQTIHLLINTASRSGRRAQREVEKTLGHHNLPITKVHTVHKQQTIADCCQLIQKDNPDLLIIAGGDGTVSQAIHYLTNAPFELGIIPLGTTNNFARSLNIPLTINEAVKTIARSKAHSVDVGKVGKQSFANVVGIGLSAAIADGISNTTKRRFGRLAYGITGLRLLFSHRSFLATIQDTAKELTVHFETHQLIVANGRYHAGKQVARDAKVDNRELLIFALGGRSRLSLAWGLLDFYVGRRKRITHQSYVIGKEFTIRTNYNEPVEIDGESGEDTPLTFTVQPEALRIRYPHA